MPILKFLVLNIPSNLQFAGRVPQNDYENQKKV